MPVKFIFGSIVVLMLGACQQVAWKPGAGAADLERDTASCRAQDAEQSAVQHCLKQRGWVLRQTTSSLAASADSEESTTEQVEPAAISSTPVPTSTQAPASASVPIAEPIASTAPPARNKPVPPKPKAADPLAPVFIQSWWKVGAQGADLTADQNACVETLGPAHQPDLQKRLYTRALIDCLKARGWSGY
jgi:cell division septation protein DedD